MSKIFFLIALFFGLFAIYKWNKSQRYSLYAKEAEQLKSSLPENIWNELSAYRHYGEIAHPEPSSTLLTEHGLVFKSGHKSMITEKGHAVCLALGVFTSQDLVIPYKP